MSNDPTESTATETAEGKAAEQSEESLLTQLRNWQPADVLLMPEGIDADTLSQRSGWISDICKTHGYRFCPRLHVLLYGNKRGT